MKHSRLLISLLVTLNLALALLIGLPMAGIQFPWTPTGEGERLSRQLRPETIQILPQSSEPAHEPPPAAPAAESAPEANAEKRCVVLTSVTPDAAEALHHAASDAGLEFTLSGLQPRSYWVHLPPGGGKDGATRRTETLTRAGFTDFLIVRDAGPNQYAVSLGLFRAEEAAQRLLEQLQQKGIKTARITVREASGSSGRAEIAGPAPAVEALLAKMKTSTEGQEACAGH